MIIICFNFNTNCHEFPTNYHEFYLLSRWIELDKNNYMVCSWTITWQLYVLILTRIAMNSPRIIMNFIYYPDGGHRTRIIIWKFVDNYMAIICFNLTRIVLFWPFGWEGHE